MRLVIRAAEDAFEAASFDARIPPHQRIAADAARGVPSSRSPPRAPSAGCLMPLHLVGTAFPG